MQINTTNSKQCGCCFVTCNLREMTKVQIANSKPNPKTDLSLAFAIKHFMDAIKTMMTRTQLNYPYKCNLSFVAADAHGSSCIRIDFISVFGLFVCVIQLHFVQVETFKLHLK